ncbi:hypothetical protein BMS3Abin03_00966 [bacterium BMS3Abin03]|nr:hypothetical protein BMS3Abin03_00966 [bacterium BMS3Abin03]
MAYPEWLPALVLLEDSEGNWTKYLELIYSYFKSDFIDSETNYRGIKIAIKKHPIRNNKEATFWHLITEGKEENNRTPDLRRCERIRWTKPIIEKIPEDSIKVWKNKRHSETRVCLWLEDAEYLVVLAERNNYLLLWTAYCVTENHRKRKLQKEYESYLKS